MKMDKDIWHVVLIFGLPVLLCFVLGMTFINSIGFGFWFLVFGVLFYFIFEKIIKSKFWKNITIALYCIIQVILFSILYSFLNNPIW